MGEVIAKRGRRRAKELLRFLEPVSNNPEENLERIVRKAKEECPFALDWDEPDWDVGSSFDHHGHFLPIPHIESDGERTWVKTVTLKFSELGVSEFADLGKAYATLTQVRFGTGRQMIQRRIDCWRALGATFSVAHLPVWAITTKHFDAAEKAMDCFKHGTAYVRCVGLETIAAFLDDNGLTRTRLSWKTKMSPQEPDPVEELVTPHEKSVKSMRFAGEEVIKGIGHLYQTIPKENKRDRFLICLAALVTIFGLRSREGVTLPIDALWRDARGVLRLHYFRFKRGASEPTGKPTVDETSGEKVVYMGLNSKVVPSVWVELATELFEELKLLTEEARRIAKKIERDGFAPNLPIPLPEAMTYREVKEYFELGKGSGLDFCTARGVRATGKRGRQHTVSGVELTEALAREVMKVPLLRRAGNSPVYLSEVVGITFPNELKRKSKTRFRYAVVPLEPIVLADFLGGRLNVKSAFEAYSVMDSTGKPLWTQLHALRRFIDDVLDRGGLSELAQAEWFGRKASHNINYQSKTPYERADELREHLHESRFSGKLSDALRRMPIEKRSAYATARVTTIHVTPAGLCAHDFSQIPCPLHGECGDGCGELLQDAEAEKVEFLEFGIALMKEQVAHLEKAAEKNLHQASRALNYQRKQLDSYTRELERIAEFRSSNGDDEQEPKSHSS